jgi:hypothetical protein
MVNHPEMAKMTASDHSTQSEPEPIRLSLNSTGCFLAESAVLRPRFGPVMIMMSFRWAVSRFLRWENPLAAIR